MSEDLSRVDYVAEMTDDERHMLWACFSDESDGTLGGPWKGWVRLRWARTWATGSRSAPGATSSRARSPPSAVAA
jgi:hypothetical protein